MSSIDALPEADPVPPSPPRNRRAPRTDTSSPQIRWRLQEAALQIAAIEGYDAASMRRISAAVQMRTATVYSFFPGGKQELVTSGLVHLAEEFWDRVKGAALEELSPLDNLRRLVEAHLDDTVSRPTLNRAFNLLTVTDATSPFLEPAGRARIRQVRQEYVDLLVGLLDQLGARPFEARCLAGIIATLCEYPAWYPSEETGSVMGESLPVDVPPEASLHDSTWLMITRLLRPQVRLTE